MEPSVIRRLDEAVVNRIAAGEIIQRPANALKELVENSLDAKASYIQITLKSGGLKFLQIQDNGTGIRKDDLSIVCERFTTSKLSKFEDLTSIATFGFRGEALASISHVAHLTIQTKTAQELCGYKASYENGILKAPPKPCAGNQGTIITIEDLFYNMPQRRQCLKSPAEEYQKVYDVVSKYAVHNSKVAFSLKKFGEAQSLKTNVDSSQEQNIRIVYGAQVANELLPIELVNNTLRFSLKGFITKVDYSAKKGVFLLFINHRLVESNALKAAIDSVYSSYLPKGMHPFCYFNLELNPSNIDVNVHPTKHEVHFLHEEEIVEKIKGLVELQLLGSNSTRNFYKQMKLPGFNESSSMEDDEQKPTKVDSSERRDEKTMIRTDAKEQKLEKFLLTQQITSPSTKCVVKLEKTDSGCSTSSSNDLADESFRTTIKKLKNVRLTSILNMQNKIENECKVFLRKIFKEMVFVGVIDNSFALVQHETKLYLFNTEELSEELFYQRLVFQFQNLPQIIIDPPISIKELVRLALDTSESGWTDEDGDKDELAERAAEILIQKSVMLREYFSVGISATGELETLPMVLSQHHPCSAFLPIYLLRLATDVEWELEEQCFETFCRETGSFYARTSQHEFETNRTQVCWSLEHVIYPAMKTYLLPSHRIKGHLYELTNLPALYKVFERC